MNTRIELHDAYMLTGAMPARDPQTPGHSMQVREHTVEQLYCRFPHVSLFSATQRLGATARRGPYMGTSPIINSAPLEDPEDSAYGPMVVLGGRGLFVMSEVPS
jgi:hypothetical protein